MKSFIITIDTEAENQWNKDGAIATENAKYVPRFQELCEKYNFIPVWLTNYEMAMDDYFVSYMKPKAIDGKCEIGMHLHAWSTPPEYEIPNVTDERPYLIEYPVDIMEKKIKTMTFVIEDRFGIRPVSHRSGRWAMNEEYFRLLDKYGYMVDCSVTPGISWKTHLGKSGVPGSDYSKEINTANMTSSGILEVPLSCKRMHMFIPDSIRRFRNVIGETKRLITGRTQWLRVDNTVSSTGAKRLAESLSNENSDYMMFMIHSSELMPGGNPTFQSKEDIEWLYTQLDELFGLIKKMGYEGRSLKDYAKEFKENN